MSAQTSSPSFTRNRFGDEILYDVNRSTFDAVGAAVLFERQFGSLFEQPNTLFIILGSDSGLLPHWIAKRTQGPGSRYVFVELEALIPALKQRCGPVLETSNFGLTTAAAWEDLIESYRFSDYAYLGGIRLVTSLGARDAHLSDYRVLESHMLVEISEYERGIQLQLGNHAFLRRQLENVADNLLPAALLRDSFAGATAVVLGGGPSLDDILPWVEQHREHLTVIAVSRIARRLLESRLEPDIVVSIDPHAVSFDVSKECLKFRNRPLLVCNDHVSPLLLGQWPGSSVYCGDRFPWPTTSNSKNIVRIGPTVTNLAIAVAVEMGFSRVILGGVDLCFNAQGHTHASASSERDIGPNLGAVGNQVETNGGRLADTSPAFAQAVDILAGQARAAVESGCRIINPATDAARIESVEYLPLERVVADEDGHDPDRIRRILEAHPERQPEILEIARKELAWARNQLNQVRKLAGEALACNEHLFGKAGKPANFKYKKRMDRIERRLDKEFGKITTLLKKFAVEGFIRLLRPDPDHEWSDEEIYTWGRDYYQVYLDAVQQCQQIVSASQGRISARLEELKQRPDLELLLKQWDKDRTPGRVVLFAERHPEILAQAQAPLRAAFEEMQRELQDTLSQLETRHAKGLRNTRTLAPVRSKLQLLFRQGNSVELNRLAEALYNQASNEAQELSALACGYLAELDGQAQEAMASYQIILDRASERLESSPDERLDPRVEDALRRISYLNVQARDIDNAVLSLHALAGLSLVYAPQLAEALRMAGRIQEAVDVYTDYLAKAPTDTASMMKLGRLLQEAGALQAARESYNHVLTLSPDNPAARMMLDSLDKAHSPA